MKVIHRLLSKITSINMISYLTITAVTLVGMTLLEPGVQRGVGLGLLVVFTVLFSISPKKEAAPLVKHIYCLGQSVVVCSLLTMKPTWSVFPILFFILSAQVMLIFSQPTAYIWVSLITVFTGVVFISFGDPLEGVLSLLPFSAGYWFFAVFSSTMAAAELARQESQTLLVELQIAHRQLQDYAAQVEELAVSEERNRLAREMHDTLGHRLTVAAVQLEGAQRLIPAEPQRAAEMVGTVREEVREALGELRRTVATLREPLQTDISLPHALARLIKSFESATNLEMHLSIADEELNLPNPHRLVLYRAVQEALTNVQRHARAKNVWVSLDVEQREVVLKVRDDGIGFPEQEQVNGFGLRGLRERVSQVEGSFRIVSEFGKGTQLRIALPLTLERENE